MIYSKKQIELLTASLQGNIEAFKQLMKLSHNLAAFESAIKGDEAALHWLLKHDAMLAIFINAIDGNNSAIKLLLKKKQIVLAATANLVKGDDKAAEWLYRFGYEHYIGLAEAIKQAQKDNLDWI